MLSRLKQSTKINPNPSTPRLREKISPVLEKDPAWSQANMGSQKVHFNSNKRINRNTTGSISGDAITPQHDDNIGVLFDEWEKVRIELARQSPDEMCGVMQYVERNPNGKLENFQPFDLEDFWGQKQMKIVK